MLNQFVGIYVPSTNHIKHGDSNVLTDKEHLAIVQRVAGEFSLIFGGATTTPAIGYWKSETGELVAEKITVVKSYYVPSESVNPLALAEKIAREILNDAEIIALFVDLLNTGTINHLQGSYQRLAQQILNNGHVIRNESGTFESAL